MKTKIINYIKTWEQRCYFDGIPDEAPYELEIRNKVPSYKVICIAILKNDHTLKSLGFETKKSKYYDFYKKIELEKRNNCKQLKLDL
jgi:predicted phosphoadenosine phosphosulfate sulfurtransferase